MGADDDVHLPFAHRVQQLVLVLLRLEAADGFDAKRIVGEPLAERTLMLLGEDGSGHEHCDLLAVLGGLERGSDGHFRLAEPHVAADEPVHRLRVAHVALHLTDSGELIIRLLVRKLRFELALPGCVGGIANAWHGFPRRLNAQHLGGKIADGLLHLRLLTAPFDAPKPGKLRPSFEGPNVFLYEFDLRGRHVQLRRTGKLERQKLLRRTTLTLDALQLDESRYPVIAMDDEIARLEIKKRIHRARGAQAESAANAVSVQQLMMRNQRQPSSL